MTLTVTEDPPDDRTYDVAISFLSDDQPLARRLHDELAERWDVFLFTERQEEIAGKDGVEELSRVFQYDSELDLVLLREGWGETPWTRIEAKAIEELCLSEGWERMFVLNLDGSEPPPWIPSSKIWLGVDQYGLEAAVGAIDSRVEELGAEPHVESALDRAERLERERQRQQDVDAFLNSQRGVEAAQQSLEELAEILQEKIAAINDSGPEAIFERRDDRAFRIGTSSATVTFGWSQQYSNSLRYSSLYLQFFDAPYNFSPFSRAKHDLDREEVAEFTVDDQGDPAWEIESEKGRYLSEESLAERCLNELLRYHYEEA